jgi:hypothetical protein
MRIVLIVLVFIPALAFSQIVYKCPDSSGTIKFQQLPCDGGKEVLVKPILNGQGADASKMVEYNRKIDEERNKAEAEKEIALKEENNKRASEEIIKEKGIKNGKTRDERFNECFYGGYRRCSDILNEDR